MFRGKQINFRGGSIKTKWRVACPNERISFSAYNKEVKSSNLTTNWVWIKKTFSHQLAIALEIKKDLFLLTPDYDNTH